MSDEIKQTKKYEFTGETKIEFGVTFKRIRALVTIPGVVVAGANGGWVEDERNLSQVSDEAWVFGEARVFGEAQVFGEARVSDKARVSGEALVSVTPLYLSGLTYSVTITDQHMAIGCQVHAIAEWRAFDDRRIAEMDGATGSRFWRDMGPALLALCAATSRPLPANTAEPAPTAVEPEAA